MAESVEQTTMDSGKTEAPAPEIKAEEPAIKAEPKVEEPAPKAEPKAEEPKVEEAKVEAPKTEAPAPVVEEVEEVEEVFEEIEEIEELEEIELEEEEVVAEAPAAKDDLKKIEGIGPKIAELLNNAGIVTWAQLSTTAVDKIKGILTEAGNRYKMHDPTSWPRQSQLAADGEWDKLKEWQDALDGGKA